MYNRPWAVVFLFFLFHAIVDLRHRSGMQTIFYFLNIPRRYGRSAKAWNKREIQLRNVSIESSACLVSRPIKYSHKLLFRCVPIWAVIGPGFPLTIAFFSFVVARKMSLLLYQTFLQELTLAFVSVNLYLCLQYTLGVGKILYFLSR